MIKYALKCSAGHGFDAWFRDSAAYEEQAGSGAIRCPECGTPDVGKAIMAPRLAKGAMKPAPKVPSAAKDMAVAGKYREALQELRRTIESNSDYVGKDFAEEARKIHYGEAEERNIYGESSDSEAEALREEGVPFARIPWPKDDA